jgi:hypothetical protein
MDRDADTGKLDFLFDEAESEGERRIVEDWPSAN